MSWARVSFLICEILWQLFFVRASGKTRLKPLGSSENGILDMGPLLFNTSGQGKPELLPDLQSFVIAPNPLRIDMNRSSLRTL